jgi:DNA (cytosine-5)-methyltransferase 1
MEQLSMFDMLYEEYKITKKIRLIELFAGVGAQAMALERLGADFEHYRVVEFDKYAIASYNAIHGTDFPTMDITQIKGEDLGIVDTDSFTYLLTYSFPCTDLSVAGKQMGMQKGSGTRSGLLWEVERLLNEVENLPQVLIMENVTQVHGTKNKDDFQNWISFLESKGYSNFWQDLNAKNYGVAQNRDRCFMVSLLGNYTYKFPEPIPLRRAMKDYLEDNVDEKYYINSEKADKLIAQLVENGTLPKKNKPTYIRREDIFDDEPHSIGNLNPSGNGMNGNVYMGNVSPTIMRAKGEGQRVCVDLSVTNPKETEVSNCITARQDRGISNQESIGVCCRNCAYLNYNKIDKVSDVARTIMTRDYKEFGTSNETKKGVIENGKPN